MTKSATRRRILRELEYVISFDILEVLKDDGSIRTLKEMSPAARRCIQRIKFNVTRRPQIVEIELVDKNQAHALLADLMSGKAWRK